MPRVRKRSKARAGARAAGFGPNCRYDNEHQDGQTLRACRTRRPGSTGCDLRHSESGQSDLGFWRRVPVLSDGHCGHPSCHLDRRCIVALVPWSGDAWRHRGRGRDFNTHRADDRLGEFRSHGIYSHVGEIEDGMNTLTPPHGLTDASDATALKCPKAA